MKYPLLVVALLTACSTGGMDEHCNRDATCDSKNLACTAMSPWGDDFRCKPVGTQGMGWTGYLSLLGAAVVASRGN